MQDERYPRRLAELVASLRSLIERSATTEEEVLKTFQRSTAGADRQRETQREELAVQTASRLEEHVRQHEVAVASIDAQRTERIDHAARQYEDRKEEIEAEALRMRKEARAGLQEQEWLAESVFEAVGSEPQKRLQLTNKELERAEERVASLLERSEAFRLRCKQPVTRPSEHPLDSEVDPDPDAALQTLRTEMDEAESVLDELHRLILPRFFIGAVPIVLCILIGLVGWGVSFSVLSLDTATAVADRAISSMWFLAAGLVLGTGALLLLRRVATRSYSHLSRRFADEIRQVEHSILAIRNRGEEQCRTEEDSHRDRRDREIREARENFAPKIEQVSPRRDRRHEKLDENYQSLLKRIEERHAEKHREEEEHDATERAGIADEDARLRQQLESSWEDATRSARRERDEAMQTLCDEWSSGMASLRSSYDRIRSDFEACGAAPWEDPSWAAWTPGTGFNGLVPYGVFRIELETMFGPLPTSEALNCPLPATIELPAMLDLPRAASLFIEYGEQGRDDAIATLQNTMLRLLMSLPPGKARFTVIDPVGLGQSFAGFMHLADHDELPMIEKIWTDPRHIEQQLNDLTEHMENVIQTYLRNEYETIDEYNTAAGEIAEPYHFLVMADLPANLTENAGQRLTSIAQTGARCGVYTLMACDTRQSFPRDIHREDLVHASTVLRFEKEHLVNAEPSLQDLPLSLEAPPEDALLTTLVQAAGHAAERSHRVEVPFSVITPDESDLWSLSTASDLRVSIGQSGATRQQQLVLGRGTSQHALVAGKAGSGKSTLLHVLITNLAMWYSPDEIEFYLVDFKKGVEFKTYADRGLPHARVIAIESDREFGLSVLQRIDQELKIRGDLYRELGVQDIRGCREKHDGPMPRILLVVDEFQELFVDDDKLSQEASLLLDRIVRQGRAFGVHALLGSQTLDGAYSLARSTLGQMGVRIALQCTEADSYLILSEENAAARLLTRPGEAIYNDAGGKIEGNNPFQVCWLDDEVRDECLDRIRQRHREQPTARSEPFVFEGNVPADLERCTELQQQLERGTTDRAPLTIDAWLGDAIAIKAPTTANFQTHSGSNLLLVGQREETVTAMLESMMLAMATQCPHDGLELHVLDALPGDSPQQGRLAAMTSRLPHVTHAGTHRDVDEAMQRLGGLLNARRSAGSTDGPRVMLFTHALHRLRDLRRPEDDFSFSAPDPDATASADAIFAELLKDGPSHGIHVITWVDTLNNLNRTLDRNSQREYEMRVLFQMSANDSSHLIDSPAASALGIQRALFSSEDSGILEKFRPWALPSERWLDAICSRI